MRWTQSIISAVVKAADPDLFPAGVMSKPERDMLDLCTEEKRQTFVKHSASCESPIERIALAALLANYACLVVSAGDPIPKPESWEIVAIPQARVTPYRLDFALIGEQRRIYALECDGREFHLDHNRDNKRALALARQGIYVLRISGTALYRDPINSLRPLVDIVRSAA